MQMKDAREEEEALSRTLHGILAPKDHNLGVLSQEDVRRKRT
jgi:hypothetical protein